MMPGFGEKLSKFASNTKKQAQELIETNKLKSAIRKEEEAIEQTYVRIGQVYFDTYQEDQTIPVNFRQMLDGILASKQKMQELQLEIERVQGVKTCPQCGTETDLEQQFCGNCGYRFDQQPQAAPQQSVPDQPAEAAPVEYEEIPPQTEEPKPEATEGTWPPPGDADVQASGETNVCASCGTPLAEGTKFCSNCGQKVDG